MTDRSESLLITLVAWLVFQCAVLGWVWATVNNQVIAGTYECAPAYMSRPVAAMVGAAVPLSLVVEAPDTSSYCEAQASNAEENK